MSSPKQERNYTMIKLTLEFATPEAAADALLKLSGADTGAAPAAGKKPTAAEKKAAATAATASAATAGGSPAPKTPSVDDIKAAILKWAAGDNDKVKEFVRSFGIAKISDSSEAIRAQMAEKLAEAPAAEDPMA